MSSFEAFIVGLFVGAFLSVFVGLLVHWLEGS